MTGVNNLKPEFFKEVLDLIGINKPVLKTA